jgi:hypothetical protein
MLNNQSVVRFAAALFLLFSLIEPILAADGYEPLWGPRKIGLGEKLASIEIPEHFGFIEEKEAKAIEEKNCADSTGVLGIIVPDETISMNGINE